MDDAMETVDQYVFRWDAANPSGGTGFGAVAWSGDHHTARGIQRSLGSTLEVAGENAVPGLVRVERNDRVLLGRRTLGRDPGGRAGTICHALVGRKDGLSTVRCLALHAWRWQRADVPVEIVRGSLPAVPLDLLTLGRDEELDRLADELREPATVRALVALTAEVLRDPDRRFSVLDPSAGREPHALLLGLWRVFGSLLENHPLGWSFATHDTDDAKPLRFVFLTTWPAHPPSNDQHLRLDPWKPRAGRTDRADAVATELVAWILEAVPGTVNRTLARHVPREHPGRGKRTWLLEAAERALRRDSPTPRRGPSPPPSPSPRTEARPPTYTPPPAPNPAPAPTPTRPPASPPAGTWLGFEGAQRAVAGTPPDDHEAEELLEAVRVMDGSDPGLPALLARIQDRQPRWPQSLRLHYCWTLLNRRLLLHAWLGDTDSERATAVAKLYQQAVRPFAEEPDVSDKLTEVLLEERRLSREHPAARAALTHIVHDGTGLPSEHLSELLAHIWSEEPPRTSSPPPMTGWDDRPIPPTPEPPPPNPRPHPHARVTQTNRRWGASKLESPEKVMVAIGSGVVFLFILLFTLLLTR
ncbi:hypothetical protein [Streptomyces profundus]|uniref:hypothetical protein n=1 Tax=Streptomyces profundus TaxID=2867410 RepID=UPI001D16D143|nr:hypothetical protein [Streptomyces sp. MA3_2.13]UED85538.1 hypothetical protein K4G22_16170 [Streptomyces sp. MA3_2.13]